MSFYSCIYFDSDKKLSTVPKSRCALRGPFEAGQEAEVKWAGQRFIGTILKTADKGQKEEIEQFTHLASKHVQEWIEGGHDVKQNLPTLIQMSLPEKASQSTKRVCCSDPSQECDDGVTSTLTDTDKENRKRKPQGEKNNSKAKKVKKTSQNKTATKSSKEILKPPNPKTAEHQASVSAVKEIYNSFATAGFPPSVPVRPPPPGVQPGLSCVQSPVNVQIRSPNAITNPVNTPSTIQQQNLEHRGSPTAGFPTTVLSPPSVQPASGSNMQIPASGQILSPTHITSSATIPCTFQQQNGEHQTTPSSGFPPSVLAQSLHPVQLSSPAPIATPTGTGISCTIQRQNVVHQTTLSETAEMFGRAMAGDLDTAGDFQQYPAGSFSDLLQSDELIDLREENRRLQEENKMLRSQLKNQPVPSPAVLKYMEEVLSANSNDGSQLLPIQSDVATQAYSVRANLEPRFSQLPTDTVRLMDYSEVQVNRTSLRSVVQGGHSKGPLHLLKKLIPLVFTTEELGGSCGQGIGKSKKSGNSNDNKRALDQHKVSVCKDYVMAFCVKNNKDQPKEKDINLAFTQAVTYARTKLKSCVETSV